MAKKTLLTLALAASFGFGFVLHSMVTTSTKTQAIMKRVTSIGGIFFKCKDPEKMNQWYKTHLGLDTSPWGAKVPWEQKEGAAEKGYTLWTPFPESTKYFEPSSQDFMINFRVENLEALVAELKKEGVTVVDELQSSEYGKFIHILDLEGNKIELWEP